MKFLKGADGAPRWHYFYFALAAFDLITVASSLALTHNLMRIHEQSVERSAEWASKVKAIGGVAALWLMGHTLNIYSMIGLILLIGLVAKNSILLVDMTNQVRGEGKDVDTALREACPIRMRPVLMTSATIILALLPAALGLGAGSDTNGPLAVAVIGGMISSTLLTLVVVPSVYSLVENAIVRWQMKRQAV